MHEYRFTDADGNEYLLSSEEEAMACVMNRRPTPGAVLVKVGRKAKVNKVKTVLKTILKVFLSVITLGIYPIARSELPYLLKSLLVYLILMAVGMVYFVVFCKCDPEISLLDKLFNILPNIASGG